MAKRILESSGITSQKTDPKTKKITFETYSVYLEEIDYLLFPTKYTVAALKNGKKILEKKNIKTRIIAKKTFESFREKVLKMAK